MPIDVTANYIRIRVANPSQFIRFRVKTLGKGIKAVIGFRKAGGSEIQSILFPRNRYTLTEAKAWVKSHGYTVSETFLVTDIIIPKIGVLLFEEIRIEETEEQEIPRPKREKWEWMLDYD